MASQVEAAAVTEEVSLIAVPANNANPVFESPSQLPSIGNRSAASTLNRKITEIACATSSSFAPMTGAVAALADYVDQKRRGIKVPVFNKKVLPTQEGLVWWGDGQTTDSTAAEKH